MPLEIEFTTICKVGGILFWEPSGAKELVDYLNDRREESRGVFVQDMQSDNAREAIYVDPDDDILDGTYVIFIEVEPKLASHYIVQQSGMYILKTLRYSGDSSLPSNVEAYVKTPDHLVL